MSLITPGRGRSDSDPASGDLCSSGYNLMVGGGQGQADPLRSQNHQGRPATQKRRRTVTLSSSQTSRLPGVREASDNRRTPKKQSFAPGFFSGVPSPHPHRLPLGHLGHMATEREGTLGALLNTTAIAAASGPRALTDLASHPLSSRSHHKWRRRAQHGAGHKANTD